jgi:lipopolysaccharide transport system permease protein
MFNIKDEQSSATKMAPWDWEIKPETTWWNINLKEVYSYKDLLLQLTRKDFLGLYQQTLLGPFWVLLQPLLTVLTYLLVFNKLIGIPTDGVPPFFFYLIGITLWNLFSEVFLQTSKTFSQNAEIFGKVYFPRIIVALSNLWLQLLLFLIQMLLLTVTFLFFIIIHKASFEISHIGLILPAIIVTSGIGFGGGLIFSVLTAKYRDLLPLMQLIIRLLMFVCPVFYSLAIVPKKLKWLVNINPLSAPFELFRFAFLGKGNINAFQFFYSAGFMVIIVCFGIVLFNKMSDRLMDVI